MSVNSYVEEARDCRKLAVHFAGRTEAQVLMSIARAFDDLAVRDVKDRERLLPCMVSEHRSAH